MYPVNLKFEEAGVPKMITKYPLRKGGSMHKKNNSGTWHEHCSLILTSWFGLANTICPSTATSIPRFFSTVRFGGVSFLPNSTCTAKDLTLIRTQFTSPIRWFRKHCTSCIACCATFTCIPFINQWIFNQSKSLNWPLKNFLKYLISKGGLWNDSGVKMCQPKMVDGYSGTRCS